MPRLDHLLTKEMLFVTSRYEKNNKNGEEK